MSQHVGSNMLNNPDRLLWPGAIRPSRTFIEIAQQTYAQPRQTYTPVQSKKRHTFWWIMGWIFIFPIPATILIVRSKKMHWILKIVLVLAVWGLYLAIGLAGSKGN